MATTRRKRPPGRGKVRDPGAGVEFEPEDFEVLDLALHQDRELRLCAAVVKAGRAARLRYPVKSAQALADLLPARVVTIEGHQLRAATVARYLPDAYFPIRTEADLIARCYLALRRCRGEMAWAASAPPEAKKVVAEFTASVGKTGRGEHVLQL